MWWNAGVRERAWGRVREQWVRETMTSKPHGQLVGCQASAGVCCCVAVELTHSAGAHNSSGSLGAGALLLQHTGRSVVSARDPRQTRARLEPGELTL